jgi:hypothetical protein
VRDNKTRAGCAKQLNSRLCYCGTDNDISLNVSALVPGSSGLPQSFVKLSRAVIACKAGTSRSQAHSRGSSSQDQC